MACPVAEDRIVQLIAEQRKRLIASIMSAAETSPWWIRLNAAEQRAYREKVLSSIGVFYDFCRDVVKVSDVDVVRNEHALNLLQRIHDSQRSIERTLSG